VRVVRLLRLVLAMEIPFVVRRVLVGP